MSQVVRQAGQIGNVVKPGKTRWECVRKDNLSLSQLSDLLATEKAASGKYGHAASAIRAKPQPLL
jgi:hypothetical protein